MIRRRLVTAPLVAALGAGAFLLLPGAPATVHAQEYELESEATYVTDPDGGEIAVTVGLEFTNTTPDPDGQFSVFEQVRLAVHDEATGLEAADGEGALDVTADDEDGVRVATIELREPLRFEETVDLEMTYRLPDTDDPRLRVRPSVVVFPAWSFGTGGRVRVTVPDGYEVRVDGDPLRLEDGAYVSGEIEDPSRWLALVTALRPAEYVNLDTTVALAGGTADLRVRAFADDTPWGERIRDLMTAALPLLEAELGLPYPLIGQLVVTETVPADASGFGESAAGGTEILIAYDQPEFTAVHQVSHVWLSASFADARWIREGLASAVASRVAAELDLDVPFNPAEVVVERAEDAFALDAWTADGGPAGEAYGYAASWAMIEEIEDRAGPEAVRRVLRRVAGGIGPYQAASIEPEPAVEGVDSPAVALSTRSFLDHLETVTGDPTLADLFAERAMRGEDVSLLPARAEARREFERLAAAAGGWGTPDPVRGAMTAWSFENARRQIEEALAWLAARDELTVRMQAAGLSPSDRLQQTYRAFGGGSEADAQLDAHAAVLDAYVEAAERVNAERSLVERIGLIGGPDPGRELALANGHFASGELRESLAAITEARRILVAADTGGIVRLVSAGIVLVLLLAVAAALSRRRASYTARP